MSTTPKPRAIHMHIDELVLRGFNHIDAAALSAALEEALSRELRSAPALRDADLPRIRAAITLPAHYGAAQLGGVLAQTLAGIAGAGVAPATAKQARQDTPYGNHHG